MVTEIISSIVDVITGFLSGIGSGIVDFFKTMLVTDTGTLTTFAIFTFAMMGLSFVIGLVTKLMGKW